ncbi:hypothetical protein [Ruminococcus sp.]|uniref:hypothetical protein n=1 Tax=Ruminococcus sp. TaxID=41978 RepID=UPI00388F4D55
MTDIKSIAEKDARVPRMRTVNEAAQELKALDAHTAIAAYHIRRLCLDGVIPTVKAGKKILLNLDTLIEYMDNPTADKFHPKHTAVINGIRRIS